MQNPLAHSDVESLAGLFHLTAAAIGDFVEVGPGEMPSFYRRLLVHVNHMTVTIEEHHHGPVDVRVLESVTVGHHYARKILLTRQSDEVVVQYGIMRLNLRHVPESVRREVEKQTAPLGRILIQHNVLRQIHLHKLWRIVAGAELRAVFSMPEGSVTYGRTAWIDVDGEPAVELLEIVAPE